MSELLVSAMNSATQIMQAQAVNTNNLANVSTDGFRAEIAYISGIEAGAGVHSTPDLSVGATRTTGRALDVSIDGKGWIAVMTPDGNESYTRRGDLHVDAFGLLKNGVGHQVMGNNGPIALPPFSEIEIGKDGTISIQPLGQAPNTMAVIDRVKLVLLEDIEVGRGEDGLMRLTSGGVADPDASVQLSSGSIEGSNVNAVAEMVKMIDLARRFEYQVKLMQTAEENATTLSQIMSMN